MSERLKAFLDDLSELTRKHSLALGSCGCCNSIHVFEIESDGHYHACEIGPMNYHACEIGPMSEEVNVADCLSWRAGVQP